MIIYNFNKESAEIVLNKVEREGKLLCKDNTDYITSKREMRYFYRDMLERDKHIKEMIKDGWIYYTDQNFKTSIYSDIWKEEYIDCYTAYFIKKLEPINWNE